MQKETISKSYFCVLNNPCDNGYEGTPEEIIEKMKNDWINGKTSRSGYWAYCISPTGVPHIHMILESKTAMRFSAIKKVYPKMHCEISKADKKSMMAYIKKEPPYDEKGEQVITSTSFGIIEGNKKYLRKRKEDILDLIKQKIDEGLTPEQVMSEDIRFRNKETLVRKEYFAKRFKETPPIRDVKCYWHIGESGTGKTYEFVKLCNKYGEDNVYLFSDYANNGVGGFDSYNGEKILFIDELKPNTLPYNVLLTITQGYKQQVHCRYANSFALWEEVHITSVYPPEEIYENLVEFNIRKIDTIEQLLRRINKYIYHYKIENEYKTFELEGKEYIDYYNLKAKANDEDIKNEVKNVLGDYYQEGGVNNE